MWSPQRASAPYRFRCHRRLQITQNRREGLHGSGIRRGASRRGLVLGSLPAPRWGSRPVYGWDTLVLLKHYLESGLSKTAIARQLGVSRRAIYHWIRTGQLDRELSGASDARRAAPRPTKLDRYQPLIQERLMTYPELSAVRLLEECRAAGYAGGYSQLKAYVARIRARPPSAV